MVLLPLVLLVYFDANAQDFYLQQYFYTTVLLRFLWSTVELPNVHFWFCGWKLGQ